MEKQRGFGAVAALAIVLVIAAVVAVGWFVLAKQDDDKNSTANNSSSSQNNEEEKADAPNSAQEYQAIKAAITEQSTFCTDKTAAFSNTPATLTVVAVDAAIDEQNNAVVTDDYTFARVVYGCEGGTQGEVAVLQKTNGKWNVIAEDAAFVMPCSKVDGKNIPKSILPPECYASVQDATPRATQN